MKHEFIRRRAAGESYAKIAEALSISKSTCHEWETEMRAEIAIAKQEALSAVYDEFGLQKAARIRRLGRTLQQIDDALDQIDLSTLPPDKLLSMKLKYAEALRSEYTGAEEPLPIGGDRATEGNVFYLFSGLLDRVRNGEVTVQQAKIEMQTIQKMSSAYTSATSPYTMADAFAVDRELQEPTDIYTQIGDGAAADRRAELMAEEARDALEADMATAPSGPTISRRQAQTAVNAQVERLVETGNVKGLQALLTEYMEDE